VTTIQRQSISRMRLRVASAALILAVVLGLGLAATQPAQAQTFKVLHNFTDGSDGGYPYIQPVVDSHGNIFGTASGDYGYGNVWEYSSGGQFSVLHSFDRTDGSDPSAGVKLDKGNMFGTTDSGGTLGYGTVFEITAGGNFTTLYNFGSQNFGPEFPDGGVTLDRAGNLYGTSYYGGAHGWGTVWKLSRSGSLTVLHSFDQSDGSQVAGGYLKLNKQHKLYGVASAGGKNGNGTLFEINSDDTFSVLRYFTDDGSDGCGPIGSLVEYKGALYGTASSCGDLGNGTVWQYNLSSRKFTVLYTFRGLLDGGDPIGGVGCQEGKKTVCAGHLYGTTQWGGAHGRGTVWEIDAKGKFSRLHSFCQKARCVDGENPLSRTFVDKNGNIYGTAYAGGLYGYGTLWKIEAKKAKRR